MPLPLSPPKKIAKLLTGNKHKQCVKELNVIFRPVIREKKKSWIENMFPSRIIDNVVKEYLIDPGHYYKLPFVLRSYQSC